jgi:hypothetical protein
VPPASPTHAEDSRCRGLRRPHEACTTGLERGWGRKGSLESTDRQSQIERDKAWWLERTRVAHVKAMWHTHVSRWPPFPLCLLNHQINKVLLFTSKLSLQNWAFCSNLS